MAEAVVEHDGDVVIDLDDGSITPDTSSAAPEETRTMRTTRTTKKGAATKKSKRMTVSSRRTSWQTSLREAVVPFLPPPITRVIVNGINPLLAPYVGPEATVTLSVTLLGLWIVTWIATKLLATRSGRAIADDEDEGATKEDFDATAILTGPRTSGKTRLFYQLCFSDSNVPTLMSIKANVGIATHLIRDDEETAKTKKTSGTNNTVIRYVDWPGYARISDSVLTTILKSKKDVRLVLVLDATQPIAPAVDVLDQWLTVFYDDAVNNSTKSKKSQRESKRSILVACHKMDLAKAKNDKRIKIQMRTEIERIVTAHQTRHSNNNSATTDAVHSTTPTTTWCSLCSIPLELNDLPFVDLHFCATTCEGGKGPVQELVDYCCKGVVLIT